MKASYMAEWVCLNHGRQNWDVKISHCAESVQNWFLMVKQGWGYLPRSPGSIPSTTTKKAVICWVKRDSFNVLLACIWIMPPACLFVSGLRPISFFPSGFLKVILFYIEEHCVNWVLEPGFFLLLMCQAFSRNDSLGVLRISFLWGMFSQVCYCQKQ